MRPHNINSHLPCASHLANCPNLSFLHASDWKLVTQSCRRLLGSCPNFMIANHYCWQKGVCLPSNNLIIQLSVEALVAKANNLVSRTRMEKVSIDISSHGGDCYRNKRGMNKEISRLLGDPFLV